MRPTTQAHWLWLSAAIVLLDQLTKQWVERTFQLYESLPVVESFRLTLVYNRGAAFSFLSDQGGWQRWFFIVLALGITLVLILWLLRLSRDERWTALGISMIIGGAVGNLIDRVLFGHVIDFLDFYYGVWHWPAFNLADAAIALGVALLILDGFRDRPEGAGGSADSGHNQ